MKNYPDILPGSGHVLTVIAIFILMLFVVAPVSASTCHPGFVVSRPTLTFQYSLPSFSGGFVASPVSNQGSGFQFSQSAGSGVISSVTSTNQGSAILQSRPSFSGTAPSFLMNGKGYTPINPFWW